MKQTFLIALIHFFACTGCGRNTLHISICYPCGVSELRQAIIIAPSSYCLILFFFSRYGQLQLWFAKKCYLFMYIYISYSRLSWLTEGDLMPPFLIATTPRRKGGHIFFPLISSLTLHPYLIMLSVKQEGIKYHFSESLVWLDLGLNPSLPDHWCTLWDKSNTIILQLLNAQFLPSSGCVNTAIWIHYMDAN